MFRYTRMTALREGVTWVVALATLVPFYFLVTTALKGDQEFVNSSVTALPESPSLENFVTVLTATGNTNILAGLVSSLVITSSSIALLIVLGSATGYVVARTTARWGTPLYYLFVIAIILPNQLATLPLYIAARDLGLTGSVHGMIILYTSMMLPLAVFLYSGFFRGLSTEYEQAATIDGASRTQVFLRIVLPLMGPATGTVAIMAGLIIWNDFFQSLIFLGGSGAQTLPVSMYYYIGSLVSKWNQIFAIVIISMIPILFFYLIAQKRFIQGFSGGLKG